VFVHPAAPSVDAAVEDGEVPSLGEGRHDPPQSCQVVDSERFVLSAEAVLREEEQVRTGGGEFVERQQVGRAEVLDLVACYVDVAPREVARGGRCRWGGRGRGHGRGSGRGWDRR